MGIQQLLLQGTTGGGPSISSFTAAASPISAGSSTTLTAVFSGGTGSIDQSIGAVTSGVAVSTGTLSASKTYTLSVTDGATTVTASVTVTVVALPSISSFSTSASYVNNGNSATLYPVFSNGTGSINQGVGGVSSGGSYSVTPSNNSTITYTLTVTNAAGSSTTATVSVRAVPLPNASLSSSNAYSTNGNSVYIYPSFTSSNGETGSVNQGVGGVSSGGTYTVTPPSNTSTTYTLTVTNLAGSTATASTSITAVPAPSITSYYGLNNASNTGASIYVTNGQSCGLYPTFSNGTGSIDQGVGTVTSGNIKSVTAPSNSTTYYTLTVTNLAGTQVTGTVTVITIPAATITSFSTNKTYVTNGGSATLSYNINWSTGGSANINGTSISNGSGTLGVTPGWNTTTYYTLTVKNAANTEVTAQVSITTVASPTASITVVSSPVSYNTAATLTTFLTGGTGSVDNGIGTVLDNHTYSTGSLTTNKTYTLTVTNLAGDTATSSVTVKVYPQSSSASYTGNDSWTAPGSDVTYYVHLDMVGGGEGGVSGGRGGGGAEGVIGVSIQVSAGSTYSLVVGSASSAGAAAGASQFKLGGSVLMQAAGAPGNGNGGGSNGGTYSAGSNGGAGTSSSDSGGTRYGGGAGGSAVIRLNAYPSTARSGGASDGYSGGTGGQVAGDGDTLSGVGGGGGGASALGDGGNGGDGLVGGGAFDGSAGSGRGSGGGGGGSDEIGSGAGGSGKDGYISFSWPHTS